MSTKNLVANEIVLRMCLATGAKNASKLSELLGYKSTGTISGWKASGSVPDSVIAKISEISGASFQWIKTGVGDRYQIGVVAEAQAAYPAKSDEEILLSVWRKLGLAERAKVLEIAKLYAGEREG